MLIMTTFDRTMTFLETHDGGSGGGGGVVTT
jgi:hypothetical protein